MLALAASLTLHLALLAGGARWLQKTPKTPNTPNVLQARLAEPAPQPQLTLPPKPLRTSRPKPPPDAPAASPVSPAATLTASAHQQLSRLDFYPLEAIQNGWQGEAWVQIFLDEEGNVIAARLEASSGYPLLDAAAVNAARSLKRLSRSGLDSAILPVRFRLE
jgi:protein TonB